MILVTTAGKVGSEAARLLAQRGVPVRVLVRSREKAAALADTGAELAEGDLEAPATIDAAMSGVSSVVLVSPAEPAHELNVIDSVVRARAEHVVKITSKASADSPIARRRNQSQIEDALVRLVQRRELVVVVAVLAHVRPQPGGDLPVRRADLRSLDADAVEDVGDDLQQAVRVARLG